MSYSDATFSKPAQVIFPKEDLPKIFKRKSGLAATSGEINLSYHDFAVRGQGVVLFKISLAADAVTGSSAFTSIYFQSKSNSNGLKLVLNFGSAVLYYMNGGTETIIGESQAGLVRNKFAFYWASIDTYNEYFRFGIGEARFETQVFSCNLSKDALKMDVMKTVKEIEQFGYEQFTLIPMRTLRDPVSEPVALLVKATDELSMTDIAGNKFKPKANLNEIGQKLYENVAGKNFVLDDADFPMFSAAIERSLQDPNGWCYKKLKAKSGYPEKKQAYLRITLGHNSGESPGIPYVLEIWPPGCYSSRHNHAGANALIRVLHGAVNVELYPYLGAENSYGNKTFFKDDITWISPTLNQFHKLHNKNDQGPACVTIQCYMYDSDDNGHYADFDYIGDGGEIEHYHPGSDMDFLLFRNEMKKEWLAAHPDDERDFNARKNC